MERIARSLFAAELRHYGRAENPHLYLQLDDKKTCGHATNGPDGKCNIAVMFAAVMLRLRARYVSKAAILTSPGRSVSVKIEVPFEFQRVRSIGAAISGDGFTLANLTA